MSSQTRNPSIPLDWEALIARYIETEPGRGEGSARLADYGVDVWALVVYHREAADGDSDAVADAYHVPIEALQAALAYYERHRDAIDAEILIQSDLTT